MIEIEVDEVKRLSQMTLEEKIGQLFVCGFHGTEPSESVLYLLAQHKIGGVIYFSRNVEHPKQVYQLSAALKNMAALKSDIPPFIGMDQEGGMVARLTEGVTLVPGNMALGAVDDDRLTEQMAKISGQELRALGVNMNFAPAVDVNNNPHNPVIGVRSFGDDPERVARLGVAAVNGYNQAGICSSVKHFPGHGDTATDSHFSLPVLPHDRQRVEQVELVPFKKAISHGVDMVMTAHIVFPELEPSRKPATLSYPILTGLLREDLGYDGVIVTDCLEMEAISETYGTDQAAVMALEAGADLLLISHTVERQLASLKSVKAAVESGRLTEERIDASVQRILDLKKRRQLSESDPSWAESANLLQSAESIQISKTASERSITLIKDENNQLPLSATKQTLVISPQLEALNAADESFDQSETLATYLDEALETVREITTAANPEDDTVADVVREAKRYDQVIVVTYNASMFPQQIKLVKKLLSIHKTSLSVVAVRNPFDFLAFPEVPTQLACYESRPLALRSTAAVLLGQQKACGVLPVNLVTPTT